MLLTVVDDGGYDCWALRIGWGTEHPRLQILTVEELLNGKAASRPPTKALAAPQRKRWAKRDSDTPLLDAQVLKAASVASGLKPAKQSTKDTAKQKRKAKKSK